MSNLVRCPQCAALVVLHDDDTLRCIECHELYRRRKPALAASTWKFVQRANEPKGTIVRP